MLPRNGEIMFTILRFSCRGTKFDSDLSNSLVLVIHSTSPSEILVSASEMTYIVSGGALNSTHSLSHSEILD